MLSAKKFNDNLTTRFVRWLRVQEYTEATNRHYLSSIVSLCRFLDDIPATDVTHLDIRDFLASVAQRGVKRSTIWRAMSALRCFFDFLNRSPRGTWGTNQLVSSSLRSPATTKTNGSTRADGETSVFALVRCPRSPRTHHD